MCVRSPQVQAECLHDATGLLTPEDDVCTQRATKSRQSTHVNVFIQYFKSRTHMISPIRFVHAGPRACPNVSHWLDQYFIISLLYKGGDILLHL